MEQAWSLIESLPTEPLARKLRTLGCPAVRLGRLPHPKDDLLPAVLPDFSATGRLAVDHFAERQFRHVAYIGRNPWALLKAMYDAYRDRAKELGCAYHLLRVHNGPEKGAEKYDIRAREVGEWLTKLPKPIGILAFSDTEAAIRAVIAFAARAAEEDIPVPALPAFA